MNTTKILISICLSMKTKCRDPRPRCLIIVLTDRRGVLDKRAFLVISSEESRLHMEVYVYLYREALLRVLMMGIRNHSSHRSSKFKNGCFGTGGLKEFRSYNSDDHVWLVDSSEKINE